MGNGKILEMGSHKELVESGGTYSGLVKTQELKNTNPGMVKKEESVSSQSDTTKHDKQATTGTIVLKKTDEDEQLDEKKVLLEKIAKEKIDTKRYSLLNKPEWPLFFIGFIGAAINGVVMPIFSILLAECLTALGTDKANFWALMFVCISSGAFLSNFAQIGLLRIAGEKLTRRVRALTFATLMKQEIAFFDRDENSIGTLTAKLAEDTSLIQGLTGQVLAATIQALAAVVTGLTIAFIACWQLSLVILGVIPIMGAAGYFQLQMLTGYGKKSKKAYDSASKTACESVTHIRTVLTLSQESKRLSDYVNECKTPHQLTLRGAIVSSFGFAFSQGVPLFAWSVAFYYGAKLISWGLYDSKAILNAMFAIIFTSMSAGQVNNHTPDAAKAKLAAYSINQLLDRVSLIDVTLDVGEKRPTAEGHVNLNEAKFAYPTRPNTQVLKGLTLDAKHGQTLALVGHSGCGKSTVIALLERWYDVTAGCASLDDMDVRKWNLKGLRSHISLVGQEPVLFNTTIRENIIYGVEGQVDEAAIIQAAKDANIHTFITSLPDGYDTIVGEKGGQLSGGQKQRVAIARALIRNPKVLLLDEATSALDSESEKLVQEAIDQASKGRTTISIAHRLSTIQHADSILVLKAGNVVEKGTHDELIALQGEYYNLVSQQMLST